MTLHDPDRESGRNNLDGTRKGARWGAAGVGIVALVVVLALALVLLGPTNRLEEAANWPKNSQSMPPPIP
ncbi:MAG: hypothetical protein AB7S70_16865 [Hyphomicrobium sp.]|uniref:hypothetical protein n=1 Tax=Hyphomicrobium sp. TaxID=82 RepID=UPI003D0C078A